MTSVKRTGSWSRCLHRTLLFCSLTSLFKLIGCNHLARKSPLSYQFVDLSNDQFLDLLGKRTRSGVIDHRVPSLVPAFPQHPERRNVGEHVVAVTRHTHTTSRVLAREAKRIIDDDLT